MPRKSNVTRKSNVITIETDSLLNMTEAIKYLHITARTMFRWINKGKIQPIRIGGHLLFSSDELKRLKGKK